MYGLSSPCTRPVAVPCRHNSGPGLDGPWRLARLSFPCALSGKPYSSPGVPMPKSGKPRGIVLRYGYPGFWFGAAVLGGLGAMLVLPGINLAINPPAPTPGKAGLPAGMGFIFIAVGVVFVAFGGLL